MVRFELSPVEVHRFAPESDLIGAWEEPDYDHRPAAVLAMRRLTLWFGDGPKSRAPMTSKRLRGWARLGGEREPSEAEWAELTERALAQLAEIVERHSLPATPGGEG